MAERITDARYLLQMLTPDVPIILGSHIVLGTITDFENPDWATVRATLYTFGPPVMSYYIYRDWLWPAVQAAVNTRRPLHWF